MKWQDKDMVTVPGYWLRYEPFLALLIFHTKGLFFLCILGFESSTLVLAVRCFDVPVSELDNTHIYKS